MWLSCLAALPIFLVLGTVSLRWIDGIFDSPALFVGFTVLLGLFFIGLALGGIRIFRKSPLWLLPIAIAAWGGLAGLLWNLDILK